MFSLERTANCGPNAVSVVRLRGCWSTIQLRPDHIGTRQMFLRVKIVQCIMGNEHTFVEVHFRIVCDQPARVGPNFAEGVLIDHTALYNKFTQNSYTS